MCAVVMAAGCAKPQDDGIATANGGTAKQQAEISDDPQERMRRFAQCMRDNGVDMPDPQVIEGGDGEFKVEMGTGAAPPEAVAKTEVITPSAEEMAKFKRAHEACQQFMPEGGPMGKPDPQAQEQMREFSKCMRDNGVPNFPDPTEGGGIAIGPGNGVDPRDPAFQEAQKKCEAHMPMRGERHQAQEGAAVS